MQLRAINAIGEDRRFHFVRLRSDGEELDHLWITVTTTGMITRMEILNNIEGDCAFDNSGQLLHCTAWESEDSAQEVSSWSHHYTNRVGRWKGTVADALRIFASLRHSIYDTYLKHLLGIFPGVPTEIVFDDSLHTVQADSGSKRRAVDEAPGQLSNTVPIQQKRSPLRKQKSFRLGVSALVLLASVYGVYVAIRYARRTEITRSPIAQRILSANLFPAMPMLNQDFASYAAAFTPKADQIWAETSTRGRIIPFRSLDDFLDQIFPLNGDQQIAIFHRSIMSAPAFSVGFKAEALRRLLSENLARVISAESTDMYLVAFAFLDSQTNKQTLADYLLATSLKLAGTSVATEALLGLVNLVWIQHHAAGLLSAGGLVAGECSADVLSFREPVKAFAVCEVHRRFLTRTGAEEARNLKKSFDSLALSIIEYALQKQRSGHRLADLQLQRASMTLKSWQDADGLRKALLYFNQITDTGAGTNFRFRDVYLNTRQVIQQRRGVISRILGEQSGEQTTANSLGREERMRNRMVQGSNADAELRSAFKEAWHGVTKSEIESLLARKKKMDRNEIRKF